MKKIALLATLSVLAFGANANEGVDLLQQLDVDSDGAISQEEAAVVDGLSEQWSALDANADGLLDEAEFAQFEITDEGLIEKLQGLVEGATEAVKSE